MSTQIRQGRKTCYGKAKIAALLGTSRPTPFFCGTPLILFAIALALAIRFIIKTKNKVRIRR